ncbi:uncharacterized protein HMPREF1541_05762 [Cyphellophora europaea CBS 101466]|uniref:P-loop containing nucleoside triphosphate hydrolase protein n=1 Tax=Cyphellophora europaea (strain CBS 101466) TaxID=1220924 RepID=W2RSQ0_CYPE1|nr:uncharacterized protein HMPREF1541_05762 [Cyphellophora europaea CBS 101466]ETN39536.1 hypothetical protein HMPREF1541_05762 [Cyphellophora europaea CBS 101466]
MATTTRPRLIDQLPTITRSEPMAVLVLSPARSGTTSVESALTHLGYNVYKGMKHAFLYASRGENTYPQWSEALDAKYALTHSNNTRYGTTTSFAVADFDKILGNYDAVVGWPLSCFPEEALAAYPDAKVILMDRPTSSWSASMRRTLVTRLTWPSWKVLLPLENGLIRDCIQCGQRCLNAWTDGNPWDKEALEKRYEEHNALVKRECEKQGRPLLVYEAKEGWAPLCKFLAKEVPDAPFPREAAGGQFEKQGKIFWAMALAKVIGKGVVVTALSAMAYFALKYLRRR